MKNIVNTVIETIKETTTWVYTNANGYRVLVCKLLDEATKKTAYGFYIQTPNGELSDLIMIKRSQWVGKNSLNWLLDYEGDFTAEDIAAIRSEFQAVEKNLPVKKIGTKLSKVEVYQELCSYAEQNQLPDVITFKDGYCNMDIHLFKEAVTQMDSGYSVLEVKKMLKQIGLLRVNGGRSYDFNAVDSQGKAYKTISFLYQKDETEEMEQTSEVA